MKGPLLTSKTSLRLVEEQGSPQAELDIANILLTKYAKPMMKKMHAVNCQSPKTTQRCLSWTIRASYKLILACYCCPSQEISGGFTDVPNEASIRTVDCVVCGLCWSKGGWLVGSWLRGRRKGTSKNALCMSRDNLWESAQNWGGYWTSLMAGIEHHPYKIHGFNLVGYWLEDESRGRPWTHHARTQLMKDVDPVRNSWKGQVGAVKKVTTTPRKS